MEEKHTPTPGPWDREATRELLRFGRKNDGEWSEGDGDIPDDRDVDLVIAAPELLASLEELFEGCEIDKYETYERAKAAIAKAKGEINE